MSANIFVDTNVLLYAADEADSAKNAAARNWMQMMWRAERGRLSFQVLQEFYANFFRTWPKQIAVARAEISDLFAWHPLSITEDTLTLSWRYQDRYKLSFWDGLILASAKAADCEFLLSEDFQAGQMLDGIRVVNPFLSQPEAS